MHFFKKYFILKISCALLFTFLASPSYSQQSFNVPIDFETPGNGADWGWNVFENSYNPALEIVPNPSPEPLNSSSTVAKFTALQAGAPWAGCESTHGTDLGSFSFDETNSTISIMVWKSVISDVGLKFVDPTSAALTEIKVANTLVNQWQELIFDFSAYIGQYPQVVDQIVVFPDFDLGGRTQDNVVFFDNISFSESDVTVVLGCTDPAAQNYNPSATQDDESCTYANVVLGCTDPAAENYNPNATENDNSCTYANNDFNVPIDFETPGNGADWGWNVFENSYNPALEIVPNPSPEPLNSSSTVAKFTALQAGAPWAGCESTHGTDLGSFSFDETNSTISIMVWKSVISDVGLKFVDPTSAALTEIKVANTLVNQWQELIFDFSAYIGQYPQVVDQIVVFPDFDLGGRTQDNVVFFDNISFSDNEVPVVLGCTDPAAQNYNPSATQDDESCISCELVTVNFSVNAGDVVTADYDNVVINGSFAGPWFGWGVTLTDEDDDGVYSGSAQVEAGITHEYVHALTGAADGWSGWGVIGYAPESCALNETTNYSFSGECGQTIDLPTVCFSSCTDCGGSEEILGCTDPTADNFNPDATQDDGSCQSCDFATVNFSVNAGDVVSSDYENVVINGSFAGPWDGWGVILTDEDGDGIYTGSTQVEGGITHEYVHAITGAADGWSGWGVTGFAPESCAIKKVTSPCVKPKRAGAYHVKLRSSKTW